MAAEGTMSGNVGGGAAINTERRGIMYYRFLSSLSGPPGSLVQLFVHRFLHYAPVRVSDTLLELSRYPGRENILQRGILHSANRLIYSVL